MKKLSKKVNFVMKNFKNYDIIKLQNKGVSSRTYFCSLKKGRVQ